VVPHSSLTPEGYHTNLALQYLYQEKIEDAARHARIALDFAPTSYAVRSLSARIEKAKGNVDAAIDMYEKLVVESPGDSEGYYLIGRWSMEQKNWTKAAEYFKRALTQGNYTTEVLNDLAFVEIQLGNSAGAVEYWQKSLVLNANQPDIQKQLESYKQ
jgi:Tfp pilus assembly protein PilF